MVLARQLHSASKENAMGTVGLSFGSPTRGTGINVSSTVATIVSNLQKVETPWKDQLTSLTSQDTAISSLGTLLSTLSNDISQLTDVQGVLAQKSGSSSDSSVLQLTSASSSAQAGTHQVIVNSLAQTSSGYLTPITNVADKLSGSMTITVGSGTAHTITLNSSNNTLAGLASAINASGSGVSASVLADANGSRLNLVSGTSGAAGGMGPNIIHAEKGDLTEVIQQGGEGGMPSFKAYLNSTDINNLSAYLNSIGSKSEPKFKDWWIDVPPK